jgi:hypothetical protein
LRERAMDFKILYVINLLLTFFILDAANPCKGDLRRALLDG